MEYSILSVSCNGGSGVDNSDLENSALNSSIPGWFGMGYSVLVDSVVALRYVMISVIMVLVASEMTAAIPMNPNKSCAMSASHCCQHVNYMALSYICMLSGLACVQYHHGHVLIQLSNM